MCEGRLEHPSVLKNARERRDHSSRFNGRENKQHDYQVLDTPVWKSVKKQKCRKLKGKVNKTTLYFNYRQVPRCLNEEFHVHINYFCALAYL